VEVTALTTVAETKWERIGRFLWQIQRNGPEEAADPSRCQVLSFQWFPTMEPAGLVIAGGGSITSVSVLTDANGCAAVSWTVGEVPGPDLAQAHVVGFDPAPVVEF
jgi:hypothetical protein